MDKNLIQRLITGTIFVVVLVGCMLWNQWSFAGLFFIIVLLGLWEFYGLAEKAGASPQKIAGLILGALVFLFFFFLQANQTIRIFHRYYPPAALVFGVAFFIPFLLFFIELFRKKENPFANIAYTILGIVYVALPFSIWNLVVIHQEQRLEGLEIVTELKYTPQLLIGFFVLLWTSDSMAYVCGRLFGKNKLFERISPKKTWEGFIGGMVFAMGAGYLLSGFYHQLKPLEWVLAGMIVAIAGTLGDLAESMFKRSIGVKDSGTILPGHGGILDRFDAALLASPFLVAYFLLFSH